VVTSSSSSVPLHSDGTNWSHSQSHEYQASTGQREEYFAYLLVLARKEHIVVNIGLSTPPFPHFWYIHRCFERKNAKTPCIDIFLFYQYTKFTK